MEKKKKVGVDIDDVVVEFLSPFLEYSNEKNGTSFKVENVENYRLWETSIHNSKEESISEVMDFQNSSHFEKIDFIEGVKEVLIEVARDNSIYFVTSRPTEIKEKTEDFLKQKLQEISFEVIHSGEIYGGKSKSEICRELGVEFMIEDNPHYALDCAEKGIKVFLLDKPWNKNYQGHENIIKLSNWEEILNHLKKK